MGAEIHGGHENNEEYFNRVYNETCRSVSRFVVSKCGNMEDAEDIIQNVYTRFFKRISEKGYEDIESPEAFLINIAKFECRTYFSDRKKDDKVSSFSDYTEEEMVAIEREMSKPQQRLEDVISNKIVAKQIFDDIMKTDELTGQIFYLHFACDMKLEDVAKALDVKLSTVKNKLYRTIENKRKIQIITTYGRGLSDEYKRVLQRTDERVFV